MHNLLRILPFLLALPIAALAAGIPYEVDFEGLHDSVTLKTIKSVSQLVTLKKRAPASVNALRYRAEADVPEILNVLHAHGYLEATVNVRVEEDFNQILVIVSIKPGPVYKIGSYDIELYCVTPEHPMSCSQVQLKNLGISIDKPAIAQKIVDAEMRILRLLSECGYPLAKIDKRETTANGETKTVAIELGVQTGPLCQFGPVKIQGITTVQEKLIRRKMQWREGQTYNAILVESTQKALMDTGLFSSILITHGQTPDEQKALAMTIEVTETKHRSVNVGVFYQTYYGPGATFGWENRNIHGLGRKLSLQGDVTKRSHSGLATYLVPDFWRVGQNFIWQAQAYHESITAYSERSYTLTSRLERTFSKRLQGSIGLEGERLYVTDSADNGNFWLIELPIYLRWSTANSPLNPTKGATFEYYLTPSANMTIASDFYIMQEVIHTHYLPVTSNDFLVFAQRFTFGTMWSKSREVIPLSKRFLASTENELRGYRYKSVSPLNHHHKPLGGRSALYYTFEARFRLTQSIGLVPFFDFGNVWSERFPTLKGKWLKSIGIGARYFSFMGPFRLDVALPLDRRKHLDPRYQIYLSIGQTF